MKKTLIALMALAGVASAAVVGRTETLWTMTFGTDIDGTNDYLVTGSYAPTSVTRINGETGDDYVSTAGKAQTQAIVQWGNGSGMSFGSDWEVEIVFTLPEGYINNSADYPALVEITNAKSEGLRVGPYKSNSEFRLDGHLHSDSITLNSCVLNAATKYTATVTFYEGVATLKLDGKVAHVRELSSAVDQGNVVNFYLGGRSGGSDYIQANIHSMSAYKIGVVPEPTTATLSLLALAGLAARRRRK